MEKYWSVEDCCWVDCPGKDVEAELLIPQPREEERVQEPVEA